MNEAVAALSKLVGPLAELLDDSRLFALDPTTLMQAIGVAEDAGRAIDALRVTLAGEVADRSRSALGTDALSYKLGSANAIELLALTTRASGKTLANRVRLAKQIRHEVSPTGALIPGHFPAVAAALESGRLGVDVAMTIVESLSAIHTGNWADLANAENRLVAGALGDAYKDVPAGLPKTFEETEIGAVAWKLFLDPDGVRPSEEEAMKNRCVSKGVKRRGVISYRLNLLPEIAGAFDALLDAYTSPRTQVGFPTADEQAEAEAAASAAGIYETSALESASKKTDKRTHVQKRHDALVGIISEASRSDDAPHLGGDFPTVLVTIREEDLIRGNGGGWVDGVGVPVSAQSVHQMICTGGMQKVVLGGAGKIIALGTKQRKFTSQQRRAITARDGGCIIPGCGVPSRRTEVHHVQEASRGGPTICSNGVLLCWLCRYRHNQHYADVRIMPMLVRLP